MTIKEYQALAMRTNDGECNYRVEAKLDEYFTYTCQNHLGIRDHEDMTNPGELLNGALGLTGEAGEVADMVKKYFFHGHELDEDDLIKELGDVCWYLALICTAIGISLEEVMCANIGKLKKRYPEGFSESASINRTE